jgi:hypothetical protein
VYLLCTLLVFVSSMIAAQTRAAQPVVLDSEGIFERAERAIFQIRVIHRETGNKTSIGSGFTYGAPDQLATNYHVISRFIEQPETYQLRYLGSDGRAGGLRLVAVDAVHDLALVEADQDLAPPLDLAAVPAKGANIFAMGNPLDLGLTLAAGTNGGLLDQTDGSRILFSGSLNPGMSGGPTFDEYGRVIGINVATARNDISFIVPTRYLGQMSPVVTGPADLVATVGEQIAAYQRQYLNTTTQAAWPTTRLRSMRIPAAVSPTVRCWDASPKAKPEHLYRRLTISCKNENEIFLSDRLQVGKIRYEFIWLESDSLERPRFYRLYEALNASQLSSRADEDDIERFRCDTRFVDVGGIDFKTTLCRRGYKQYPSLSDVLFTAAMTGKPDRGFIFNLDLYGTDFNASLALIGRFLEEIAWRD